MSLLDFDAKPDAYAVMGNPIAHSKSPRIHALFAEQTGQRLTYTAILVEPGGFDQAVGNFQANGGKGLNVTVPFKQEAWRLVDRRSPRAERAGAVNTVTLHEDGSRSGDNTDGIGLVNDLSRLGVTLTGCRVLILGAGGAVRGVLEPLLDQGPAELWIANRTVARAEELASAFASMGTVNGCGFDDLKGRQFDVIINGTAASLQGEVPPLPDTVLGKDGACYDMMYAARPTAFIQWARRHGATAAHDGLGMLVAQAAESFFIWRGVRPETGPVIEALRRELAG
ncbi:shikimate dehydrogenase [Thiohalomonas denitrificans]|uniref:Shikimate dehydrogenase (NADP(+)) n=1 Tax=Thiohalomonas denitrificans TaxID=415747 RepID=A0A1G5QST9_9GAMM|nr:shikimate dehydrogenase [Thiohalomonas denitrificans]SCZ64311.1 shikimate dehydrogenase [Thiohalomonas denitrificans]